MSSRFPRSARVALPLLFAACARHHPWRFVVNDCIPSKPRGTGFRREALTRGSDTALSLILRVTSLDNDGRPLEGARVRLRPLGDSTWRAIAPEFSDATSFVLPSPIDRS